MNGSRLKLVLYIALGVLVTASFLAGCGRGRTRSDQQPSQEAAPSPTLTEARVEVAVPTWTPTPEQPPTPVPATPTTVPATDTPEPTPEAIAVRVRVQANVRAGPGISYGIVGSQQAGDTVHPISRTLDGQWLELGPGRWLFASLVEGDLGRLPINRNVTAAQVADSAPASTPTPAGDQIQTAPSPTPAVAVIPSSALEVRVRTESEVRAGPDTVYETVGIQQAGDTVRPVARTRNGRWLELASGHWISSTSVEGNTDDLPIATTFPPTPTATVILPTPTVTAPNSPPAFVTWVDGRELEFYALSNHENLSAFGTIGAKDADSEDTAFRFAITGGDDKDFFTLDHVSDSNSVIVSFVDSPNYELPLDQDKNNDYKVQLTVTSGIGARALSTTKVFTFIVWDQFEPPGAPTILEDQTAVTATTITVYWEHGKNPGPPLSEYVIRYEAPNELNWIIGPDLDANDTEATLEGLTPGTEYRIEVIAVNPEGESYVRDASIKVTTLENE